MEIVEITRKINWVLAIVFLVCYAYQFFYIVVPLFFKSRKHKKTVNHRFAVLIPARNESAVIGNLIESIRNQIYKSDLITVFVIADNCSDGTAEIARKLGAVVYERFNTKEIGKGHALENLYDHIVKDYGDAFFDAYMVFDADNVLAPNYISEMNKSFCDGYEVLTSYRNSKNYGDNWISAGYGLWFLRESVYLNYARMLLHTGCAVSGTGFLFASSVIREMGGWKFFLLTEDIEFSVCNALKGRKIGYCKDAHFYDEQPTKFSQSWNQRMRWAKGFLQVWKKYGRGLIRNVFSKKSFTCYDMTMTIFPALVISLLTVLNTLFGVFAGWFLKVNGLLIFRNFLEPFSGMYFTLLVIGAITTVTQWKNIHCKWYKKALYTFTFPIFMLTYIPITIAALFKKVEWTPTEHSRVKSFDEIQLSACSGKKTKPSSYNRS